MEKKTEFYHERICTICGKEYMPVTGNQKYCCAACRQAGHNALVRLYYQQHKSIKAEVLAAEMQAITAPRVPAYSLAEVNEMARSAHTTYGKFVATRNI